MNIFPFNIKFSELVKKVLWRRGIKGNLIPLITVGSVIGLILLQYNWILTSQQLIEEQFNQKVSLALCNTVQQMSKEEGCKSIAQTCEIQGARTCTNQLLDFSNTQPFKNTLEQSLEFYQIQIPYEIQIIDNSGTPLATPPPGCCPLEPIVKSNNHYLSIQFPTKQNYFLQKVGFMLLCSIVILILISSLLLLINYRLINQKRIMQVNKDFFNSMAHEFRTPLTNINLATQLLQKKWPPSAQNRYLTIINKECGLLMAQINRVLDYAKLDRKSFPLNCEKIDIQKILSDVIDQFGLQIQQRTAILEFSPSPSPIYIFGDSFHVKNTFKNLLDNALKHHPNVPTVKIAITELKSQVIVSIQDDGPGIPENEQALIFDPFYTAKSNKLQPHHGFGIGLAYVKKILSLHAGTIAINSKPNQGTSFTLSFPNQLAHE